MRAINSSIMKHVNRRMVLNYIRRQAISRAELADYTQLTRASITQIVEELMTDGLVEETASVGRNRLGRRQMQLEIVPDARFIAGVNLGRTSYDVGIINLGGEVLWHRSGSIIGRAVYAVLDEIADTFAIALDQLGVVPDRIHSLGITSPGPVNSRSGVIVNPTHFQAWHNVRITEMLKHRTGWDAWLGNISDAHALDEMYFGIGRTGVQDFMLLRVDEGVGAGIVLDGKLFTGPRGQNPEIGHITLDRNGPLCECGNRGCMEKYLAFPDVLQGSGFSTWQQVMDALDRDPAAMQIFRRVADDLAFAIVNIENVFNLDRIVLSSNFTYRGDRLAAAVNTLLRGRGTHIMKDAPVIPGSRVLLPRIAAMPAYYQFFRP